MPNPTAPDAFLVLPRRDRVSREVLLPRARQMRSQPTPSEAILWSALRGGALGVRARRQHPMGPFILDFYVPRSRLVIEVDGAVHLGPEAREADGARDAQLRAWGLRVVRLAAGRVERELGAILEELRAAIG